VYNTQLINAGMPEEIREHMMGHKFKDRVRDAYFLADPDELRKIYLRYIEHLSVKSSPVKYSLDMFVNSNNRIIGFVIQSRRWKKS